MCVCTCIYVCERWPREVSVIALTQAEKHAALRWMKRRLHVSGVRGGIGTGVDDRSYMRPM